MYLNIFIWNALEIGVHLKNKKIKCEWKKAKMKNENGLAPMMSSSSHTRTPGTSLSSKHRLMNLNHFSTHHINIRVN